MNRLVCMLLAIGLCCFLQQNEKGSETGKLTGCVDPFIGTVAHGHNQKSEREEVYSLASGDNTIIINFFTFFECHRFNLYVCHHKVMIVWKRKIYINGKAKSD